MISMVIMACLLLTAEDAPTEIDGPRFAALLQGLYQDLEDIELICEGKVETLVWSEQAKSIPNDRDRILQAKYAYRFRDEASYLDVYSVAPLNNHSLVHTTMALLDGRLSKHIISPERQREGSAVAIRRGGLGSLRIAGSPEKFIYYFEWNRFIKRPSDWFFKFHGWEEIEGHRCALVEINKNLDAVSGAPARIMFWIDMERGGHPLKEEYYRGQEVGIRVDHVELMQFPLPSGKLVWIPIYGEFNTYLLGSKILTTPVFHESYRVVRGSVVLNQKLPDARFSVESRGRSPTTAAFQGAEREFAAALKAYPRPEIPRTDPAGVQEYQDRKLAEADAQAAQLDASPFANDRVPSGLTTYAAVALSGAVCLGIGLYFKRKRRAA